MDRTDAYESKMPALLDLAARSGAIDARVISAGVKAEYFKIAYRLRGRMMDSVKLRISKRFS